MNDPLDVEKVLRAADDYLAGDQHRPTRMVRKLRDALAAELARSTEAWRVHDPIACADCRTPVRRDRSGDRGQRPEIALERLRSVLTDSDLRPGEKTAACRGVLFEYDKQRKAST